MAPQEHRTPHGFGRARHSKGRHYRGPRTASVHVTAPVTAKPDNERRWEKSKVGLGNGWEKSVSLGNVGCHFTTHYLIRSNTLKIGMYSATIIAPTMAPTTAIMIGSMREVRALTLASTSAS